MSELQVITQSAQDGVLILKIELTQICEYEVSQQVSRELAAAIKAIDAPRVVVDLSNLEMMTSVAYLPFVGLRAKVLNAKGAMALCNLTDVIRDVFETARLLVNARAPAAPFLFSESVEGAIRLVKPSDQ